MTSPAAIMDLLERMGDVHKAASAAVKAGEFARGVQIHSDYQAEVQRAAAPEIARLRDEGRTAEADELGRRVEVVVGSSSFAAGLLHGFLSNVPGGTKGRA